MGLNCIVCEADSPRYKCSTCYALYCSPGCWKTHKDSDNCNKPEIVYTPPAAKRPNLYITDDTIPQEKLQKLRSNPELKQVLKDPLLQKLLKGVDYSTDPNEAVQKAMQDPSFVGFVDLCLGMVEDETDNE